MSSWKKTLVKVMSGSADANIAFADLCTLLWRMGYSSTQSGSHNIFRKAGCELINLQDSRGKAKAYQVKQVREQLSKYQTPQVEDYRQSERE